MSTNRRLAILVAFSFLLLLQTGCRQEARGTRASPDVAMGLEEGGPEITFESLVYDFGKVGPGVKNVGDFKFTNTGNAPLKITEIKKCCGVVAKVDKKELEPDESGVLAVTYTSGRTPNKMRRNLYVSSNDAKTPQVTLTIAAETVLRVRWEPRNLKLLLKDANAECPKITLTSTDGTPFSITGFRSTGNCLTADFDDSVRATEFVLEPHVNVEKLEANRFGRVNITLAFASPKATRETVTVIYQTRTRFTVMPSMLIVFYDRPGEPVSKSLWIANNYGEDFEIESTGSKEGHIKVLSQKKVGGRYQFELEVTPPSEEGVKSFTDVFTANLKGDESLDIKCRGVYSARSPRSTANGQ